MGSTTLDKLTKCLYCLAIMLYFISVDIQPHKLACTVLLKIPRYSVVCQHTMLRLGCSVMYATGIIGAISSKTINSLNVKHVLTVF